MRAQLNHMSSSALSVNIAGGIVFTCFPYYSSYIASKHAVLGLTKAAAEESGARNIRVNAVAPQIPSKYHRRIVLTVPVARSIHL